MGRVVVTTSIERPVRQFWPVQLRLGKMGVIGFMNTWYRRGQARYPCQCPGAHRRHPHDRRPDSGGRLIVVSRTVTPPCCTW